MYFVSRLCNINHQRALRRTDAVSTNYSEIYVVFGLEAIIHVSSICEYIFTLVVWYRTMACCSI